MQKTETTPHITLNIHIVKNIGGSIVLWGNAYFPAWTGNLITVHRRKIETVQEENLLEAAKYTEIRTEMLNIQQRATLEWFRSEHSGNGVNNRLNLFVCKTSRQKGFGLQMYEGDSKIPAKTCS